MPPPATPMSVATLFEQALRLQEAGQLTQAELCCRHIVRERPQHFDSHHLLGVICARRGHHDDALLQINIALRINPKAAFAHYNRGLVLQALKRFNEALASYDEAIALRPTYAEAFCNRGNTLSELKRFKEAIVSYDRAIALKPHYPQAFANSGVALQQLDRWDEARASLEAAVALAPSFAEAHYNLANVLRQQGERQEAVARYQQALAITPDFAEAHSNLGVVLSDAGKLDAAVTHYEQALVIMPNFAEAHFNLANTLRAQGKLDAALAHYERALAIAPQFARAHCNLGVALKEQAKLPQAAACFERALGIKADDAEPHNNLAAVWTELGHFGRARRAAERAIELAPKQPGNYYTLSQIKRFTAADPWLAAMEELARDLASLPVAGRIKLHFALGKAYEDVGRYRDSFDHLLAGNALKRQETAYDEGATLGMFRDIRGFFTPELMSAKHGLGERSRMPIFILGMPRSGTTLVEQILASHPQVFGAGELELLPRLVARRDELNGADVGLTELSAETVRTLGANYLAGLRPLAPQARRITDKMPANFAFVGLIHLMLPNARIIHTRRNPIDTCVSCFSTLFTMGHPYTYDLAELGRYYGAYQETMDHWRKVLPAGVMLEVQYEDVVADLEGEARRMVAHCELPWDDICLSFHETERTILTASAAQVRRRLYRSSVGRWRAYQGYLQPLRQALDLPPDHELKSDRQA